jgi:hypothetical protein
MKENTITILTETFEEVKLKSGLPSLPQAVTKAINISEDALQKNLNNFLTSIFGVLSKVKTQSDEYEIDSVDFSLIIGGQGEIMLLGTVKGGVSSQTSITVSLKKRNNN